MTCRCHVHVLSLPPASGKHIFPLSYVPLHTHSSCTLHALLRMQAGAAQGYGHAHAQQKAEAWERQQRSRKSSQELQHAERANEAMRPDDPDAAATGPLTRATDIHGPAASLPSDREGRAGTLALGGGAASAAAKNPSPQDDAWNPRSAESSTLDSQPGATPSPSATPNPSAQQPLAQQKPAQLTSTRQMSASSTQNLDDLHYPPQQPPVVRRPYSAAPGKRLVSARPPARPSQLTNSTQTVGSLFPSHTGGPTPLTLGVPAPPILLDGGVATPAAARAPRAPPPRPPARQPSLRQPPSSVTLSLRSGVPRCSGFQSSSPRPASAPSPASTPPRVWARLSAAAAAAASGRPQTAAYGPPSHESAPHRQAVNSATKSPLLAGNSDPFSQRLGTPIGARGRGKGPQGHDCRGLWVWN